MKIFGPSPGVTYSFEHEVQSMKGLWVCKSYLVKNGKRDKYPAFNGTDFQFRVLMSEIAHWADAMKYCADMKEGTPPPQSVPTTQQPIATEDEMPF